MGLFSLMELLCFVAWDVNHVVKLTHVYLVIKDSTWSQVYAKHVVRAAEYAHPQPLAQHASRIATHHQPQDSVNHALENAVHASPPT